MLSLMCSLLSQVKKARAERDAFARIVSHSPLHGVGLPLSNGSVILVELFVPQAKSQQSAQDRTNMHRARDEYAISKLKKKVEVRKRLDQLDQLDRPWYHRTVCCLSPDVQAASLPRPWQSFVAVSTTVEETSCGS